jgi:uncharacterized membrane protein
MEHTDINDPIVSSLADQVRALETKVDQLTHRLEILEQGQASAQAQQISTTIAAPQQAVPQAAEQAALQGPPALFDTKALLPRISTICFLLVVALILRTITDNGFINIQAGSILGMIYAAILILFGWRLYGKNSQLAPIFPGCGILLLFSIVLETHGHYKTLSTNGAYLILFLAGLTVFILSMRHKASNLIFFGVPGTAAAAMAVGFPYPNYAVLSFVLLAAIFASSYAYKQLNCRYLRWLTLFVTILFWLLWTFKMAAIPRYTAEVVSSIDPNWFMPMLFVFWGAYLVTAVLNVLKTDLQLGIFESIIPTLTAAGVISAGYVALESWYESGYWFYGLMVVVATLHLGLATWLAKKGHKEATGVNVFILAGACLIVMTSAIIFKHLGYILPVWSVSALGLAILSAYLHNEGVRITSYLLQAAACYAAIATGAVLVPSEAPFGSALASLSLGLFSLIQYVWSRTNVPDGTNSFFFSRVDKKNYTAVILLVTGLFGTYFFAQLIAYYGLSSITENFIAPYKSGQSLIMNICAVILLYIALRRRNREILTVGSIVALVAGGKVFIFDLFGIKGIPLVLSVFSTGIVAAFGSVVMGKWHKKTETAELSPSV